jgi:5'-nucleotidase
LKLLEENLKVLVANDDGPDSPALQILVQALVPHFQVAIAVPSQQRSGTGHGFTFSEPLRVERTQLWGAPALLVSGLPSDAVKFAICEGLEWRPDLVVAGINPGENAGVCAPYSGTTACAREAALWGLPAMALSSLGMDDAHYRAIASWVVRTMGSGLPPLPTGTFWNVNFPHQQPETWGEVKICRGSTSMFRDHYRPVAEGLWQLEGRKPHGEFESETDDFWLEKGHPAMVPHRADPTDFELLARVDWLPAAPHFPQDQS